MGRVEFVKENNRPVRETDDIHGRAGSRQSCKNRLLPPGLIHEKPYELMEEANSFHDDNFLNLL